jgi:hypothetical protein
MPHFPYEIPVLGTIGVVVCASIAALLARKVIESRDVAPKEHYRLYRFANTVITVLTVAAIIAFWSKIFEHKGQFWGLIGAGLASPCASRCSALQVASLSLPDICIQEATGSRSTN